MSDKIINLGGQTIDIDKLSDEELKELYEKIQDLKKARIIDSKNSGYQSK